MDLPRVCTRCHKPESAHPVVPWLGMKCYEFQAPPPVVPPPPKPPRDDHLTASIRGGVINFVAWMGPHPINVFTCDARYARKLARHISALADLLDPPTPPEPAGDEATKREEAKGV